MEFNGVQSGHTFSVNLERSTELKEFSRFAVTKRFTMKTKKNCWQFFQSSVKPVELERFAMKSFRINWSFIVGTCWRKAPWKNPDCTIYLDILRYLKQLVTHFRLNSCKLCSRVRRQILLILSPIPAFNFSVDFRLKNSLNHFEIFHIR